MIARVEKTVRRVRRFFSRSEWLIRLLHLPPSGESPAAPGLMIIQIDGLSQAVMEAAMREGRMAFLRRLIRDENYRLHRHYSGLPSATAGVQGELFYGVPSSVPGYAFLDVDSGRMVRMIEPGPVAHLERTLGERGEALLRGGSCYVDNFTGGAAEPHFCPAVLGWGETVRHTHPLVARLLMFNPLTLARSAGLAFLEVVVAVVEGFRGMLEGYSVVEELKMIPSRVAVGVVLRELSETGAKMDLARGLPVVHVNLLGYDEQAHRRGPRSLFARRSLRGIDGVVRRLWGAAQRSVRRHYDVWIYSDHGQESTKPYRHLHGRDCSEAIADVFSRHEGKDIPCQTGGTAGIQLLRAAWRRQQRDRPTIAADEAATDESDAPLAVAALGPVAMIYYARSVEGSERAELAANLVKDAGLPMVLAAADAGQVLAWTAEGRFELPRDGARLLGGNHPFLDDVTRDLITLCHHQSAGTFMAFGWTAGAADYVTFAYENGSHGGPGPRETGGFALLPEDAALPDRPRVHLRPSELRHAALVRLGRKKARVRRRDREGPAGTLRVMTYNTHSSIGMDGRLAPERIVRAIGRARPDIVALQEIDVGRHRSGAVDQAELIAERLGMEFFFHPTIEAGDELYGHAVLSHLPMRLVKAAALPPFDGRPRERRSAIWTAVEVGSAEIQFIGTHLGLREGERRQQAEDLLGPAWLGHPDCAGPAILCGDFNAMPWTRAYRTLEHRLRDVQRALPGHRPKPTYSARFAAVRIDHIFVRPTIEVVDIDVPDTALARVASDHLPLVATLRLKAAEVVADEPVPERQAIEAAD